MCSKEQEFYQSTIHWTKCSERMPTDDMDFIIAKADLHEGRPFRTDGWTINHCKSVDWYEWSPCDEETWRKLNDARNVNS